MANVLARPNGGGFSSKPGPLVDLALTLPLFLVYQLGVVFLNLRNGTDLLTAPLMDLARGDRAVYLIVTTCIGVVFAGVFALLGRGQAFRASKFVQIAVEGIVYAVAMRILASYVVGNMLAGANGIRDASPFAGVVESCGAGFYEELAFRVVLFGLGAKVLVRLFAHQDVRVVQGGAPRLSFGAIAVVVVWCAIAAAVFSGVHYIGAFGDTFKLSSFVFRWVLGITLSLIYLTRGFAAAVWTHALYDVWVIVL